MKSNSTKLAVEVNKMKSDIDKEFVRMAEELTEVRCKMADTVHNYWKANCQEKCKRMW